MNCFANMNILLFAYLALSHAKTINQNQYQHQHQHQLSLPSECNSSTVGCFSLPSGCRDNCQAIFTYTFNTKTNMVDITMKTICQWCAFTFNDAKIMPDMRGVMCINDNGKVQLTSRLTTARNIPQRPLNGSPLVQGNKVKKEKFTDGVTECQFSRTVDVPLASELFMYDLNTNRFALYAFGTVLDGVPSYHGLQNKQVTNEKINIFKFKIKQTKAPSNKTTTKITADVNKSGKTTIATNDQSSSKLKVYINKVCQSQRLSYHAYPHDKHQYILCFKGVGWKFKCPYRLQWKSLRYGIGYCGWFPDF